MLNRLNIEISDEAQAVIDQNGSLENDLMMTVDIKNGQFEVELFYAFEKGSNELHNVDFMSCQIEHLID